MKKNSKKEHGLLRNKLKLRKMEAEFSNHGIVVKNESGDVYPIKTDDDKEIRRHAKQLRF